VGTFKSLKNKDMQNQFTVVFGLTRVAGS